MDAIDETHDPELVSWVASANAPGTDFPVQNLPFGVYRKAGTDEAFRCAVAIGDQVFDLAGVDAAMGPTLNELAAAGQPTWRALRRELSQALTDPGRAPRLQQYLVPQAEVELGLPVACGDYTDFFTSYHHAYNAGKIFRPDAPVTGNFKWLPIAYHGRASSLFASGTPITRPWGQRQLEAGAPPTVGPCNWLDYEVELGLVMGPGNAPGSTIPIEQAEQHLFGLVLLNDWSARDIQAWEYQPLGPFLAKSFATTLSPWVVTLDALAPFRAPLDREPGDPPTLAHLHSPHNDRCGHLAIQVEAWLQAAGTEDSLQLSSASYASSYWTPAQLLAHHSSNGCPMRPGDILGTGTISGPAPHQAGSLLELSVAGTMPVPLAGTTNTRTFLEDGDTVRLRAHCLSPTHRRIGFGEAAGQVLANRPLPGSR